MVRGAVLFIRKFGILEAFKNYKIYNILYGDTVCQKYTSKCFTNPNRMNNNSSVVVPILQDKTNLSTGSSCCHFDVHLLKKDYYALKVVGNEKEGGSERCQTFTICL
jgi:hypothetical protein